MARYEYTVESFIKNSQGMVVPLESLSEQEKTDFKERTMNTLSKEMSLYYTINKEAYINLCEVSENWK